MLKNRAIKSTIPRGSEKALANVVEKASQIEERVEELKLITALKKFGIVIGGSILFSGFLFLVLFLSIILNLVELSIPRGYAYIISAVLLAESILQILGGLSLIVK